MTTTAKNQTAGKPVEAVSTVTEPGVQMVAQSAVAGMDRAQRLQLLRAPFATSEVGRLPKAVVKDGEKGHCSEGNNVSADGHYCGGYHVRSIHLSYVGHAAVTHRLLEVDPEWDWEPVGHDALGLPALDPQGGLWIRLTVLGVTRIGYGDSGGKRGGDATKEAIGDALRNAGMRFGMALGLWHKGDLTTPGLLEQSNAAPEDGGRNWIAEAEAASGEAEATKLWTEARKLGVPQTTLDAMTGIIVRHKKAKRP